jgi:hypothetical protein
MTGSSFGRRATHFPSQGFQSICAKEYFVIPDECRRSEHTVGVGFCCPCRERVADAGITGFVQDRKITASADQSVRQDGGVSDVSPFLPQAVEDDVSENLFRLSRKQGRDAQRGNLIREGHFHDGL